MNNQLKAFFNKDLQLTKLPSSFEKKKLVLAIILEKFPLDLDLNEKEVNIIIKKWIAFPDYAIVRRYLIDLQYLSRSTDGSRYWRMLIKE